MSQPNMTPFLGVYFDKDGHTRSLLTGDIVDTTATKMHPFLGRFLDENGEVHDISELSTGGGGVDPGLAGGLKGQVLAKNSDTNRDFSWQRPEDLVNLDNDHDVYVDQNAKFDREDGSYIFPYKSLSAAIQATPTGNSATFHLASGNSYNENIVIHDVTNWTFAMEGVLGQFRTEINGNLTISGVADHIGLENIQIRGNTYITASGGVYFNNTAFREDVQVTGVAGSYTQFVDCQFMGEDNTVNGAPNMVYFRDCSFENTSGNSLNIACTSLNSRVFVLDCGNITANQWHGGTIIVGGYTNFIPRDQPWGLSVQTSDGLSVVLTLLDGVCRNLTGSLLPIRMGPGCVYILGKFEFETTGSVFQGTRQPGGLHSVQMYDHGIYSGYTRSGDTIDAHLLGISNQLADLEARLAALE